MGGEEKGEPARSEQHIPQLTARELEILGLLAAGKSEAEILEAYPYLVIEDIRAALAFATLRAEESELPLKAS